MANIIKQGQGSTLGGFVNNWKTRWFILYAKRLCYHEKQCGKFLGEIDLSTPFEVAPATSAECPKQPSFKITLVDGRTYFVVVSTRTLVNDWVKAIASVRPAPSGSAAAPPPGSTAVGVSGKKLSVDDFELIRVIGHCSYGKVRLVQSKADGRLFVMKSLRKADLKQQEQLAQVMVECDVLLRTVHPFLVGAHYAFQSHTKIFIVLDYVPGGELFSRLCAEQRFSERRTQMYAAEILLGLGFVHKQGFGYCHLKPENVLVDRDGHLRLTDFGLAKANMASQSDTTTTFCGTPEYIAPEMLLGKPYTKSVDWWSYGILVYEMLCGIPPFYDENSNTMYRMVINNAVQYPDHLSASARDLIGKLLEKDPSRRIGGGDGDSNEIKPHPFFNGIDWEALTNKQIEAEWKPPLAGDLDTKNFDEEFTKENAVVSFVDPSLIPAESINLPNFTYVPGTTLE
jgi:serine/threonine protein kinase